MKKKILITLVVLISFVTSFWLYKSYKVKQVFFVELKRIDKNITKNDIKISGFPLKHIVNIENLQVNNDNKFPLKIEFKKLKISKSYFAEEIFINLSEIYFENLINNKGFIFDIDHNSKMLLSFKGNKISKISFSNNSDNEIKILDKTSRQVIFRQTSKNFASELVFKSSNNFEFNYKDAGYNLYDKENKLVYNAQESKINFSLNGEEKSKNIINLKLMIKDFKQSETLYEKNAKYNDSFLKKAGANVNFSGKFFYNDDKNSDLTKEDTGNEMLIENLRYSSKDFDIIAKSHLKTFVDDPLPSGYLVLKVDKSANFWKIASSKINEIIDNDPEAQNDKNNIIADSNHIIEVLKVVATYNPNTKQDSEVYYLERKKLDNQDFTINGISFMKIISSLNY